MDEALSTFWRIPFNYKTGGSKAIMVIKGNFKVENEFRVGYSEKSHGKSFDFRLDYFLLILLMLIK